MLNPDEKSLLRGQLLDWYDNHRRVLPWRCRPGEDVDPYAVWVSEVMLQQTRVDTVVPYFTRWMALFPDAPSLAAASLDEVLRAWEGLGYYSRARNLHRAVREVADRYDGMIPSDPAAFRSLPGVGRYTAGAVLSIGFGQREPLVDGNVRRVFARWMNDPQPKEAELWRLAETLVAGGRPGDLNQSLMELGATLCTPRAPRCDACPVRDHCRAYAAGTQEEVPTPKRRGPIPHESQAVAVIERDGRFLIARRPVDARLGGLWEFPGTVRLRGESVGAGARRAALEGLGLDVLAGDCMTTVKHAFTHVTVSYHPVRCAVGKGTERALGYDQWAWASSAELRDYALPVAQRKIAALAMTAQSG